MPTPLSEINMKFLAALNGGGVAAKADIARELADLFISILAKQGKAYSPTLVDEGDQWRVEVHETAIADRDKFHFDIRKADAALLLPGNTAPNRMAIATADIATAFGLIVLKSGGQDDVDKQLPLTASDQGDIWLIRGSLSRDRAAEGPGPFRLEVRKCDAKVIDMGFDFILNVPPEVRPFFQRALRDRVK